MRRLAPCLVLGRQALLPPQLLGREAAFPVVEGSLPVSRDRLRCTESLCPERLGGQRAGPTGAAECPVFCL